MTPPTPPATKCEICGEKVRTVELDCQGAKERGEPMPTLEACRCCHPGDFMCNCGKPCWSIF
jgi:hypothetical protein